MLSFFVCFLLCFTIYGFIPTYSTRIYIRIAIKSYSFKSSVNAPAALCEGAFLDSNRFIIDTIPEQEDFGVAYAHGILKVLCITKPPGLTALGGLF